MPNRKRNVSHLTIRAYHPLPSYSPQAYQILSQWLDVDPHLFEEILLAIHKKEAYLHYSIPKPGSFEWRQIHEPYGALKEVQRRILERLLYPIEVSKASHGAVPGRSVVSNARAHLPDANFVLSLDLRNAFPSVRLPRVHRLFRRYLKPLFRSFSAQRFPSSDPKHPSALDQAIHLLAALTTYSEEVKIENQSRTVFCLPQGAPTSGYLLNLVCLELDRKIFKIISLYPDLQMRYTRYLDDLTLSSPSPIPPEVQDLLEEAVIKNDFRLNSKKTRRIDASQENAVICGVLLKHGTLAADPALIERCQTMLSQIQEPTDPRSELKRRGKVRGIISFFQQIYGDHLPAGLQEAYQTYRQKRNLPDEPAQPLPSHDGLGLRPAAIQDEVSLLAQWLDLSSQKIEIARQLASSPIGYEEWQIPKRNGKMRTIAAPRSDLKEVQEAILDRFLYRIPVSVASHGFVPGRSILTNAQTHLDAKHLLNIDLKDAFPSVSRKRVEKVLHIGIGGLIKRYGLRCPRELRDKVISLLSLLTTRNDELPQGAPTSGYLLNLACCTLDKRIFAFLQSDAPHISYSRYADDLTFASKDDAKPIDSTFVDAAKAIIQSSGYRWHPEKVHLASVAKGQAIEICGLRIDGQIIRLPREKLKEYRSVLRRLTIAHDPGSLDKEARDQVQGIVGFVKMVYGQLPPMIDQPYQALVEKQPHLRSTGASREKFALYPNVLP